MVLKVFLLNAEEGDPQIHCNLSQKQQKYILENIKTLYEMKEIKNVFFLMHQTLWAIHNKPVAKIDPWTNGGPHHPDCNSFEEKVFPEILKLAQAKQVFLISGDIGCKDYKLGRVPIDSFPLFYHFDETTKIKYIGSGICEHENDNILKVFINEKSDVHIEAISLSGNNLKDIEEYNIAYWSEVFKNDKKPVKIVKKSSFSKIVEILKRRTFHLGFISCLFLVFLIFGINRINKLYRTKPNS